MREIQTLSGTEVQEAPFQPVTTLKFPITDAMRREVLNTCTKKELEDEMKGRGYRLETWPALIGSLSVAFLFVGIPVLIFWSQRCDANPDMICRLFGW